MKYFFLLALLISSQLVVGELSRKQTKVQGIVSDKATTERLSYSTLYKDSTSVTATDSRGYFDFFLESGDYTITVSQIGYKTENKKIHIDSTDEIITLFFELVSQPISLDQVTVTSAKDQQENLSPVTIQSAVLQSIPKFIESDPVRAVQVLPGVTGASTDYDSHLYVRGSNFDETLLSLDGVPLYNPYHFSGFFSSVDADILQSVQLYRSNYPISSGGYISGLVEMTSKKNNEKQVRGSAALSVSSVKGIVETPLLGGSALFSARRFWLSFLLNQDILSKYYFYDMFGKYTRQFGEKNRISVSAFFSNDVLDIFDAEQIYRISFNVVQPVVWGNSFVSVLWNHSIDNSLLFDVMVYESKTTMNANANGSYYNQQEARLFIDNRMVDRSVQLSAQYSSSFATVTTGIETKMMEIDYFWNIQNEFPSGKLHLTPEASSFFDFADNRYAYHQKSLFINPYIIVKSSIFEYLNYELGYRANYVQQLQSIGHSPFVSFSYALFDDVTLVGGYGKYYQNLYAIKEYKARNTAYTPYAVYFLPQTKEQQGQSDHLTVGVCNVLLPYEIACDVDFFIRYSKNLPSSNSNNEKLYSFNNGKSEGVEFFLRREVGIISGWLGYSLSRSVKENNGSEYFSNADRTHQVKITLSLRPFEYLKFDLFWTYATGVPYTDIVGKYVSSPLQNYYRNSYSAIDWRPIYGRKNGERTIPYQRLDLAVSGYFVISKIIVKPFIQVFNLYNASNPYFFNWEKSRSKDEQRASGILLNAGVAVEF